MLNRVDAELGAAVAQCTVNSEIADSNTRQHPSRQASEAVKEVKTSEQNAETVLYWEFENSKRKHCTGTKISNLDFFVGGGVFLGNEKIQRFSVKKNSSNIYFGL